MSFSCALPNLRALLDVVFSDTQMLGDFSDLNREFTIFFFQKGEFSAGGLRILFTLQLGIVFIQLFDYCFVFIFYSLELRSTLGLFGLIEGNLLIEIGDLAL